MPGLHWAVPSVPLDELTQTLREAVSGCVLRSRHLDGLSRSSGARVAGVGGELAQQREHAFGPATTTSDGDAARSARRKPSRRAGSARRAWPATRPPRKPRGRRGRRRRTRTRRRRAPRPGARRPVPCPCRASGPRSRCGRARRRGRCGRPAPGSPAAAGRTPPRGRAADGCARRPPGPCPRHRRRPRRAAAGSAAARARTSPGRRAAAGDDPSVGRGPALVAVLTEQVELLARVADRVADLLEAAEVERLAGRPAGDHRDGGHLPRARRARRWRRGGCGPSGVVDDRRQGAVEVETDHGFRGSPDDSGVLLLALDRYEVHATSQPRV